MKIAIISDIHSNLEALKAVLDYIEGFSVDSIFCAGDIVGYGADPVECVEIIKKRADLVVAGNHDYGVVGKTDISKFKQSARSAIEWTSAQLDLNQKKWLASLDLVKNDNNIKIVHSSPLSPESWHYIRLNSSITAQFEAFSERVCFVGHSHKPGIWCSSGDRIECGSSYVLSGLSGYRYIVNVGSVGQPRDGDSRACIVIFDDESMMVEFHRVDYDIDSAANKIISANLPEQLASRLYKGR
ncbi:metallophosphoesterase family protein [bacterium]|nr:metallophosphoesterase family protein [bacterium]